MPSQGNYVLYMGNDIRSVLILHDRIVVHEKPKKDRKGKTINRRIIYRIGLTEDERE